MKMARLLVEQLAGDYDPEEYEDDYATAVDALVKAKVEGGEIQHTPEAKDESGEVVDLLAALQRSVDAAKTSRGESTSDDKAAPKTEKKAEKKAEKKPAAKKTAAKKTSAKKTAAKKKAS
jgi:DNA end-binding protein Ku